MSIVTAVGSFGYFISPILLLLIEYGWSYTLFIFTLFLLTGLVTFLLDPQKLMKQEKINQTNHLKH